VTFHHTAKLGSLRFRGPTGAGSAPWQLTESW
jgi:hypothetical protein